MRVGLQDNFDCMQAMESIYLLLTFRPSHSVITFRSDRVRLGVLC